jgi:hypothetical protein
MGRVSLGGAGLLGLALVVVLIFVLTMLVPRGPGAGGSPYSWVCTPANYDFGHNGGAEIDVFNSSGATANVSVYVLRSSPTDLCRPCLAASRRNNQQARRTRSIRTGATAPSVKGELSWML